MGVVIPLDGAGNKKRASIEPLLQLTAADMDRVNEAILSHAKSHVELIPEIANHLINSGGKRIRPMLTLAAARMCGYEGEHHLKLAPAVEFMHTATLLHDDVVDESDLRRGKQAARVIWGNQASVLVGDYLLGQAFRMMVETGFMMELRSSSRRLPLQPGFAHSLAFFRHRPQLRCRSLRGALPRPLRRRTRWAHEQKGT